MKTAVLAFCLAITGALAQGPVTPPSLPASSPGGTDYPHASFLKSVPFGRGGDSYYLYQPPTLTKVRPSSSSFMTMTVVDPSSQEARIGHLARKDRIVIFPGENGDFAIGNTEAQRDMGTWSGGTPVREAEVTTY